MMIRPTTMKIADSAIVEVCSSGVAQRRKRGPKNG